MKVILMTNKVHKHLMGTIERLSNFVWQSDESDEQLREETLCLMYAIYGMRGGCAIWRKWRIKGFGLP